jgi:integrase
MKGIVMQLAVPSKISWQEAESYFVADSQNLSKITIENYKGILSRFSDFVNLPVDCIGRLHILKYLQLFKETGTYNHYLTGLKSFFAWVSENYHIENPAEKIRFKKQDEIKKPRILTQAEYQQIFAFNSKARDIAVFLCNTGVRVAELCSIKPHNVNLEKHTVKILGKGSKPRIVPLNATAEAILTKYNLSISKSVTTARNSLVALSRRLGIPYFTPHACRHYYATRLIKLGANIADVSKLLGHRDIKITIEYYYHNEQLNSVTDLLLP